MNTNFKNILFIGLASLFLGACDTSTTEEITPQSVSGRWNLEMITSNVQLMDEAAENSTENVADQGLYFEFKEDGTYTTNGALELGDINEGDGSISSGMYAFKGDVLELTYDDPDLQIPVTYFMKADVTGNTMQLSLSRDELVESFANTTGLDPFTQAFIEIFLNQIVTFDFNLTLAKQ